MRLSSLAKTLLCLPMLVVAGSCTKTDTTAPSSTDSSVTIEVQVDLLAPGTSSIATLSLSADSTAQVMLAGEVLTSSVASISVPLKVEIGNFITDGTDCGALDSVVTEPKLTAQLQRFFKTGVYCIKISDPNNSLPETIGVVLRVAHPVPKFFTGTVSPVTFASTLPKGGSVTKTVTLSTEGTIDITLKSLGSQPTAVVGLGIGVVPTDSSNCTLTRIVPTKPGSSPQLSVKVDAGSYCAGLIDIGNLTDNTAFSMTLSHP
jgi:hypothetical protein